MIIERYYFDKLFNALNASSSTDPRSPMSECDPAELRCFPALMFQLLAVSLQFASLDTPASRSLNLSDSEAYDRLSEHYSNKGEELINSLEKRRANLASIMHDLLRVTWLKNCSRGVEAWYPLGTAIRFAPLLSYRLNESVD